MLLSVLSFCYKQPAKIHFFSTDLQNTTGTGDIADARCRYVQIRVIRGDYFFTNVFVTAPFSVVTRTKYMPSARPETLMRVGLSMTLTVLTNLP